MTAPPRSLEHPDPQRRRESYISLHSGRWLFSFDDADLGLDEGWYRDLSRFKKPRHIIVPFAYQWAASGIDEQDKHSFVWYGHDFETPKIRDDERILLHFGAVDYEATVFINGSQVAHHVGGHVPFQVDITHTLFPRLDHRVERALLVIRVEDKYTEEQPRGKQHASNKPEAIWYTCTTGIWQPVWLEIVNKHHIDARTLAIETDIDRGAANIGLDVNVPLDADYYEIEARVSLRGQVVTSRSQRSNGVRLNIYSSLAAASTHQSHVELWSPESPTLYDLRLRLLDVRSGKILDELFSYFGMRKISIEQGRVCLNGKPYYQRLVLDQGYWPQSGLTAPTDAAFIQDIQLAKCVWANGFACLFCNHAHRSFGFNGARKHMKPEDPRWLYHCDRLGFLAWTEPAAAFVFSAKATRALTDEFADQIQRDISHPSIVTWCCINENWGVPNMMDEGQIGEQQRAYLESLRTLCKTLDPSRLVSVSDGWNNLTTSDLAGLHDYTPLEIAEDTWKHIERSIRQKHWGISGSEAWAFGERYNGQPILCTETGGYLPPSNNMLDQLAYMSKIMRYAQGFVYTQITDVMQERNGLCDENRQPKVDPSAVKALLEIIQYSV